MVGGENSELSELLRDIVREQFDERASLKKNGGTWRQWSTRVVTPERILLIAVLVFTLGSNWSDAKRDLSDATRQAAEAAQVANSAAKRADVAATTANEAATAVQQVKVNIETLADDLRKQRNADDALADRVRMNVSRAEFEGAIAQRILPRLDHLDEAIAQLTKKP